MSRDADGNAVIQNWWRCESRQKCLEKYDAARIWIMDDLPSRFLDEGEHRGAQESKTTINNGSIFRVIFIWAGAVLRNRKDRRHWLCSDRPLRHRQEMDNIVVRMKAAEPIVQRDTLHDWFSNGAGSYEVALILVSVQGCTAIG